MVNYEEEGKRKGDTYRSNLNESNQKDGELRDLKVELNKLETSLTAERTRCERQAEVLEKGKNEAEKLLPVEKDALGKAQTTRDDLIKTLQDDTEKKKTIMAELESLPKLEKELGDAEREHRDLRDRERRLRENLGKLQESLLRCAELETEKIKKSKGLRTLAEEKSIYEELALAFGKKGAQALIIEKALPEIEDEANRLLGRMTDNRMSLKIESQRDTRKGDTIETLDIRIADDLGTRDYEMFSGGESFRVNFALRIALSKLLARRAGAPLPTLIIDEGFGTQDSTGREKLVEAINSIQDDFQKILVITHLEELKDAFPVRIDVSKTEEGSTFSLN
jgi:exonuclease SbcC